MLAAMDALRKDEAYRVYITDCFYVICASLGNKIGKRYYDMLHPEDNSVSGDTLARERLERFGIKVVD